MAYSVYGVNGTDLTNLKVYIDIYDDGLMEEEEETAAAVTVISNNEGLLEVIRIEDLYLTEENSLYDIILCADVANLEKSDLLWLRTDWLSIIEVIGEISKASLKVDGGSVIGTRHYK